MSLVLVSLMLLACGGVPLTWEGLEGQYWEVERSEPAVDGAAALWCGEGCVECIFFGDRAGVIRYVEELPRQRLHVEQVAVEVQVLREDDLGLELELDEAQTWTLTPDGDINGGQEGTLVGPCPMAGR